MPQIPNDVMVYVGIFLGVCLIVFLIKFIRGGKK